MTRQIAAALVAGALCVTPVVGFAAAQTAPKPAAAKHATKAAPTHATRGVVKSIDDSTLVITRSDKTHAEMSFAVNASTQRDGTIATGSPVSVRYREDGKTNVATGIRGATAKPKAGRTAR